MTAAPVLEHVYSPRGTAKTVLECRASEVLMAGPAGTGKSRACLEKLHFVALAKPGVRLLMLRKTLKSLTTSGLVTYQKHVAAESIAAGHVKWFGGSTREPAAWKYANGSVLVVGGLDDPQKVMSTEYDIIFIQEANQVTLDDWESCKSRLRNWTISYQQLLADCNPDTEHHWLKQRCDEGTAVMLESRHWENPVYYNDDGTPTEKGLAYVEGTLKSLTGVRRARLFEGKWVSAEGMIYEGWDNTVHHITLDAVTPGGEPIFPHKKIPDSWTRWWAVDFGYTNPTVLQCWAEDPDGRLYLYRELYRTQRLVEDHALDIILLATKIVGKVPERSVLRAEDVLEDVRRGLREWTEPKPRAIICDHDAEDRATLERKLGMSTTAADKRKKTGIEAVQSRFKVAGDGRPRLFVLHDALVERDKELDAKKLPCSTVEELPGYVWADSKTKEEPVKENDHGMDALRYMIMERDFGARPRIRGLGGRRR